jgi:hypothetical protein
MFATDYIFKTNYGFNILYCVEFLKAAGRLKGIASRHFGDLFFFYWKDMKLVIGPDQVTYDIFMFNFFICFCSKDPLELQILELLPSGVLSTSANCHTNYPGCASSW